MIFGAAVFYVGWITFRVKPGFCAVMTSKTSGIHDSPVVSGSFLWRWERLLPTNVTLETFDLAPYKTTQVISGELPSAKVFKEYASVNSDFNYNIKINITMSITPEKILDLYKKNAIKTNEDLQEFYDNRSKLAASLVAESILSKEDGYIMRPYSFTEDMILKVIMDKKSEFDGIAISSVEVSDCQLPDLYVYYSAKKSYDGFMEILGMKLEESAEKNAEFYVEQDRMIKQFEKLGDLFKKYPYLQDMFKTGDAATILNAMKTIK
ncbi:MAG: hypothetical protein KBS64_05740 [Treponema sp.]|nr:hypothetical protein [Candidatus Treponema equi]